MTPFDSWYAANIEPNLPKDLPPQLAKAGKAQAAIVWNAALDEAWLGIEQLWDEPSPSGTVEKVIDALRVTP